MRTRRLLAALGAAALLAVPACDSGDEGGLPPLSDPTPQPATAAAPPARLCEAIPDEAVAAVTGRSPVTVDGAGTQCSWRAPATDGHDLVLQGSFIDTRSFEVGRPSDGVAAVPDLGDDAYLVEPAGEAPTIYVREGSVAFALWLSDPAAGADLALADLARQVLAS